MFFFVEGVGLEKSPLKINLTVKLLIFFVMDWVLENDFSSQLGEVEFCNIDFY